MRSRGKEFFLFIVRLVMISSLCEGKSNSKLQAEAGKDELVLEDNMVGFSENGCFCPMFRGQGRWGSSTFVRPVRVVRAFINQS